jgi:hypothetical protein
MNFKGPAKFGSQAVDGSVVTGLAVFLGSYDKDL